MNKQELDIMNIIGRDSYVNQRVLAEASGYSLGKVNQSLKRLAEEGFLDSRMKLTAKAREYIGQNRPRNAIILAAGFGMRMIPINTEVVKGLVSIRGETLIERSIRHLQEAGITDITVVVGFMKEAYEFLIDKYGVTLKVNMDYAVKNNLHSLHLVSGQIGNTYILPCDIWCGENPFQKTELYSWYMVSDAKDSASDIRVNRKWELVKVQDGGCQMLGIAYITAGDAGKLKERLALLDRSPGFAQSFWEEALFEKDRMFPAAKVVKADKYYEINTYEQLRKLDASSVHLNADAIHHIEKGLGVDQKEITGIMVLKKGMTNRSFRFTCRGQNYIMRIPGPGTEQLINRREEYEVYQTIKDLHLCDTVFYMNPQAGYKITAFLENARVCDPQSTEDVERCMRKLRRFHELGLEVGHTFDIYKQIDFYESLWSRPVSCFCDYKETRQKVFELKTFIDSQPRQWTLAHIDSVPDNFLFAEREGQEELYLIDWEYAGMQDACVDIAMFAIYAMYERGEVERLIDLYYPEGCRREVRLKIYCYIASCGLLWSNWCEYKRQLGVEFGEYSLRQYHYAKEYYRIFKEEQS